MPPRIVNQDRVKPFPSEAAFEEWLAAHHATAKEVWIRIYKKGSGVPTITPVQAIDVALCWGWTDGVRKDLDETSFLQRYTPRPAKSIWSQINRDSIVRLTAAGRMKPQGQRQVDRAKADGRLNMADPPLRNPTETFTPADQRVDAAPPAKNVGLEAPLPPRESIGRERAVPERTPSKRPAAAKAKPAKKKPAAPKRPAPAKAKPAKKKVGPPKRRAAAKAKPAKAKPAKKKSAARKPGAPKRPPPAPAKGPAKRAAASKRPLKAKAKISKAR